MSKLDNGGSAFPRAEQTFVDPYDDGMRQKQAGEARGMTLRDWFAGQALAGMLAARLPSGDTAAAAYFLADTMLTERARESA